MKKITLSVVVTAAMLSMGTAIAGGGNLFGGSSESSMSEGTFYGGASAGIAKHDCIDTSYDPLSEELFRSGDGCKTNGWKIFGGYKFTDNMAIEAGYYDLGEREGDHFVTSNNNKNKVGTNTGKASGIGLTGVYSQPIADDIEVFGKLGAMFWKTEGDMSYDHDDRSVNTDEDGTSVLFGLGASYNLSDNWSIRGEWERYNVDYKNDFTVTKTDGTSKVRDYASSKESVDVLSAGITFSTY